ncbi:MAG: ABC transporter permease [Alphaproteobacteria bacterium]
MRVLFDIALAHLANRKRQSVVSIGGVAMGVGFFIAMAAMMSGFQSYFIAKVIDVSPHVVMKDEFRRAPLQPVNRAYPNAAVLLQGLRPLDELRGIREARATIEQIENMGGIAAAPTLRGPIILRYGSKDVSGTMVGIEPARERRVTNIENDLIKGRLEGLLSTANGIILGAGLASKLGVGMNDTLSAISPAGIVLAMKVVGIFSTGVTTIDNFEAYSLLKKSQILQNRANVVNQLRMRLDDVKLARRTADALEARYGYRTESWEEANSNVLGIFVIQNAIMYSSVGAILVVAGFGIFNILSTVIYEKTRDIAILRSLGFTEGDVRRIFLTQGLIVGLLGTALGWVLGFALTELLASIKFNMEGFVKTQGFVLDRSFRHYWLVAIFALVISGLAAFLPARRAARLRPVDIIRGAA